MTIDIAIQPEALADLDEAFFWYEGSRHGLGGEFLHEFDNVLKRIEANPELVAPFFMNFRRRTMQRFPYSVAYHVGRKHVFIIGVFHLRRRPKILRERVKRFRPV